MDAMDDPTSDDAPIGTEVKLAQEDVFGRNPSLHKPLLLIYAGTCSGCSLQAIDAESLRSDRFEQVALLFLASENQVRESFEGYRGPILLFADPMGRLVGRLGAMTAPRFYVLRSERLSNIWKRTDEWPVEWVTMESLRK